MAEPGDGRPAPWVIVSGGFNRDGGMDKANLALADHLLDRGTPVHLVGHEIDGALASRPGAHAYTIPRLRGLFPVSESLLDLRGRTVARRVLALHAGARVVVNGGNCAWYDVNWVHYVHHAWMPGEVEAPPRALLTGGLLGALARRRERERVPRARMVLANSELTRRHLVEELRADPSRVHLAYLGADPAWGPPTAEERAEARARWGVEENRPLVVFVGALGYDDRKGLGPLLSAWERLIGRGSWDPLLVVAGGGRALERWSAAVRDRGLGEQVRLVGFSHEVAGLLAAADLLVSPVRYEPYGLNVQEALCRGVPALVSAGAGIAERYAPELNPMIIPDPENADDLAARLVRWRSEMREWKMLIAPLAERLRRHSWREMAGEIVNLLEAGDHAGLGAGRGPAPRARP